MQGENKSGCFTFQVRSRASCFMLVMICVGFLAITMVETQDEAKLKGHLQAFGKSGTWKEIEIRHEFPEPKEFLMNYVQKLKPLKLNGVAKNSRAVREWTDDYLLALDVPKDSIVHLETKKKENRLQETAEMHFHDFLNIYNHTEHYMVDDVPAYLSPDVMIPCSLQCPELLEKGLAFAMMWFSSGGTKSVIHTDSFDNINCVIRGEKDFVLMDPARDGGKSFGLIPLHFGEMSLLTNVLKEITLKTNGAYSDIDVDSVDLTRYPKLAEAEYYHVHAKAGDCLYIPYLWIHQVRSHNSNVAINFWWNHHTCTSLLEANSQTMCPGQCDPSLTLDKVTLQKDDYLFEDPQSIRDWLKSILQNEPMTLTAAMDFVRQDFNLEELVAPAQQVILEIFGKLDLDHDGVFTKEEHEKIPMEVYSEIQKDFEEFASLLDVEQEEQRKEYIESVEADRRDEL